MTRKFLLRIFSVLLAVLFMTTLIACGQPASDKSSANTAGAGTAAANTSAQVSEQKPAEVVTLQVFSMPANTSGLKDKGWWPEILKKETGVQLEFLPTGDQANEKLQALMASGELPDITVFMDRKQVEDAVKANMLLCLDDNLDKLPNAVKNFSGAMQYQRDFVSNGTGKAYTIPNNIGPSETSIETGYGPFLRWDLYKKLGMPKLYSIEDYLPLLKKMQDLEPKTADGQKIYGFSLWKDWDGKVMYPATTFASYFGMDGSDNLGDTAPFAQVNFNTDEVTSLLAPDSLYIRALKLYYNANKMGLLDPDSLTQSFDAATQKIAQGRTLFMPWSWLDGYYNTAERINADDPKGFRPVLFEGYKGLWFGENEIGDTWSLGISAATKNKDTCLNYLDFMCSIDGVQLLANGPKGVTWDINDKSEPVLTDAGFACVDAPDKQEVPGGGLLAADGIGCLNWCPFSGAFINPDTKYPLRYTMWPSFVNRNPTKLMQDWTAVTGYKNTCEMLKATNSYALVPGARTLLPTLPDDLATTAQSIGDIVKTNSWLMVYAKNEAEFNKLYDDMVTKAEGLGLQKVLDWDKEAWKKAKEAEAKYSK